MARAIAISSGHGLHIRGASASPNPEPYNDEVDEVRKIVDRVYELLTESGHPCKKFHDDVSTSQSENLNRIVNWHNQQNRDLDVSVHLNANAQTSNPMGCEVLFVTQENLAEELSAAIASAGHFKDRGEKYRGDLAFLNGTDCPAVLIEAWFCDSSADCANGRKYREDICLAIAETIADVELDLIAGIPEPEPEPPDPDQPPPEITSENRVEIMGAAQGDVQCLINGVTVYGVYARGQPVVDLKIKMHGDVTVVLNGEDFHNKPAEPERPFPPGEGKPESPIPANQTNIITTVFGGEADDEYSAYGPYDSNGNGPYLDDKEFYVALPWTVENAGPNGRWVRVINCENGAQAEGWVGDKGPWFVDDNYPELGTRPLAETLYLSGEPCPRGPNEGIVPNGAGIDISPAMANALGIEGKGNVNWLFVEPETS